MCYAWEHKLLAQAYGKTGIVCISATKLILETDKQHNLHTGKNVADCIAATCKKSNLSDAACKFADESVQALIHAESNVHAEAI